MTGDLVSMTSNRESLEPLGVVRTKEFVECTRT